MSEPARLPTAPASPTSTTNTNPRSFRHHDLTRERYCRALDGHKADDAEPPYGVEDVGDEIEKPGLGAIDQVANEIDGGSLRSLLVDESNFGQGRAVVFINAFPR